MEDITEKLKSALELLEKEYDNKMKNGEDTEKISFAMIFIGAAMQESLNKKENEPTERLNKHNIMPKKTTNTKVKNLVESFNNQFSPGDKIEYLINDFRVVDGQPQYVESQTLTLSKPAWIGKVSKYPFISFKEDNLIYVLIKKSIQNWE